MSDELRKEMDELGGLEIVETESAETPGEEVKPEETEPAVKDDDAGIVSEETGEAIEGKLKKAQEQIDNLNRALSEERGKRKDYLAEIAMLRTQMTTSETPQETEAEEVDSEVSDAVRKVMGPEMRDVFSEIRKTRFQISEEKAKVRYKDYGEVVEEHFMPLLDDRPDIAEAFRVSDDPCDFAYKMGVAMNIESILEKTRKEVSESTRKALLQELKEGKRPISLSAVGGVNVPAQGSGLRKELDELT